MQEIVKRSDGYSGSDLANLCKDAALGPLRAYGCLVRANPRCLRVGNFLVPYSLGEVFLRSDVLRISMYICRLDYCRVASVSLSEV